MTNRPQSVRRRGLGFALVAALALVGLSLLASSAFPNADPGLPTIAKKKKQKKITGKLTKRGYTVIALAKDGKAKTDRAPKGAFKLRPPAKKVTLHLRAPDGTYAGPIVVGTRKGGKRAIEGVYAGAKLGKVKVNSAKGYAKAKLRKKLTDRKREARAKKGVPIGAGNFGRVKSKKTHGGAPGDLDLDGVADPLDIDDDGDKVLDNLDATPSGAGARASQEFASGAFPLSSWLLGGNKSFNAPVNANAPSLSDEQIEAALPSYGLLEIRVPGGYGSDPTLASAELDCGQPQGSASPGLIYCTKGGTGRLHDSDALPGDPFPDCCDPDGDGLGTLYPSPPGPDVPLLYHGATSDQIKSGDVLIQRIERTDGREEELVATLQYVFGTTPALVSYDDGQGNSRTFSYPGGPTEFSFPVKAGPSGDVVVELTFWRPQRRPIPSETGDWIDIGGLGYYVMALSEDPPYFNICAPSSYSSSDPNLGPSEELSIYAGVGGGFKDLARDRLASPDNTITFQVNLTECFEPLGGKISEGGQIELGASSGGAESEVFPDITAQRLFPDVVP